MKMDDKLTYQKAKDKALRLLEFRSHSEKELRLKLLRAGASEEDTDDIIEFCRRYNFINDSEFAKRKAKDLKNLKKYGRYRIINELKSLGICGEDIQAAIDEAECSDDEEEEILYPLVEKKLGFDFEKKNIDKCMRYFLYRGYGLNSIKNCVEKIKSQYDQ